MPTRKWRRIYIVGNSPDIGHLSKGGSDFAARPEDMSDEETILFDSPTLRVSQFKDSHGQINIRWLSDE